MGRPPRILGEGITYHVIGNCNNGEFLFKEAQDFALFLKLLRMSKEKFGFELNSYNLIQSHVHLILRTNSQAFLDVIMHWLCHGYAEIYNKIHKRKGHFWRDRYKAKIIDSDLYGLACLRYIHRNSLDAGIVSRVEDWPWSCYTFYVAGHENSLITPLPSYLGLAEEDHVRRKIYKKWVETPFLSKEEERKLFKSKVKNDSIRQMRILDGKLKPFLAHLQSSP